MGRSRIDGLLAGLFAVLAGGAAWMAEPGGGIAILQWALVGVLGAAALVAAAEAWRWSAPPGRHRAELATDTGSGAERTSALLALEGNFVPAAPAPRHEVAGGSHRGPANESERVVLDWGKSPRN